MISYTKSKYISKNLKEVINSKEITLVIIPNEELVKSWFNDDMIKFWNKLDIPLSTIKDMDDEVEFENSEINIYFAYNSEGGKRTYLRDYCFLNIKCQLFRKAELEIVIEKIYKNFEVVDLYQMKCIPSLIDRMIGCSDNLFTLGDYMTLLDINQAALVTKAGLSQSHISDILRSKKSLNLNIIRKLKKAYPLSPYEYLI